LYALKKLNNLSPTSPGFRPEATIELSDAGYLRCSAPYGQQQADTPRFLVILDTGIGDAVVVGLSVIDQIIANDPKAAGTIDVLCNELQAQIFAYDPRVNLIIQTNKVFYPGPHIFQLLRGITLDALATNVVQLLKQRHYEAIFPSVFAPGLLLRLHSHFTYPYFQEVARDLFALRRLEDAPISQFVRKMVNHYFRQLPPPSTLNHVILLYLKSEHLQKAIRIISNLKEQANVTSQQCKVLLVAPDTGSVVTRPPVTLLAAALSDALERVSGLIVCIFPGYTDTACAGSLYNMLSPHFTGRVFLLPTTPKIGLLETAALIDRSDVFLSGDTGLMHIAAARKILTEDDDKHFVPDNKTEIIALFGGTNPGYFGHSKRTIIVGKGRKEQRAFKPGISKDSYNPKGRDLFDHVSPQQISDTICRCVELRQAKSINSTGEKTQ
jgi:ADP-heptose:LPS heptosyltransferase